MAVSTKLDVDISGFTSGIREGQQVLKGLNAEMKASDAAFKATGNAEQKLNSQTSTLNKTIQQQKSIADQARQALEAMTNAGVQPADAAYQKMYITMLNAEAGANEAQAALNQLGSGAAQAADGAEQLTQGLNGISKKISLDQVISGIDKITGGLENAARKAVHLGEQIWDSIMNSARWADDTATMAQMYGIDVDTFQRMQKLVTNGMDTSVEAMLKSQSKFKKGIGDGTKAVTEAMSELGLTTREWQTVAGESGSALMPKDATELFWEAGQAIMNLGDEFEKESKAQALFGKSWKELVPLFSEYKTLEEYNAALADQKVVSEDSVKNLAELNDKVSELQGNFMTLSTEVIGQLAPALTEAATALNGLLTSVLEYLDTPEGKQMLTDLGTAVSGLFEDLGKIDPAPVVEGFTGVFNTVVGSVKWISDNWEGVVTALEGIVAGWAVLKVTGGVLDIVKVVSGLQGLSGGAAAQAGAAAGSAWGSSFASAVMKAAPWLIGLYTLLNPAAGGDEIGNNTLKDEKGNLTNEAIEYGYKQTENGELYLDRKEILQEAAQNAWDLYRTNQLDHAAWIDLQSKIMDSAALTDLFNMMMGARDGNENWKSIEDLDLGEWADKYGMPELPVDLKVSEDSAASITEQVGTVEINGVLHLVDAEGNDIGDLGDYSATEYIGGHGKRRKPKANGIWSVPYDGYLATLHRGERVVPAREVQSRSYNSNLYVESMIMNNGTDAAGLAAAMAAAQRRTMSGYGS